VFQSLDAEPDQMAMRYAHLSPHIPRDAVKVLDHGGGCLGNGWQITRNRT